MRAQVNCLLEKLYVIDKELGGKQKNRDQVKKKGGDEFENIRSDIQEKLHKLDRKQNDRDQRQESYGNQDMDVIKLSAEVRNLTADTQKDLDLLNRKLGKMSKNKKKFPPEVMQQKEKKFQLLTEQFEQIQQRENNGFYDPENPPIQTLNEMKAQLYGQQNNNGGGNRPEQRVNAEGVELEAMQRWQERDAKVDAKLDNIIVGTQALQGHAKQIGGRLDDMAILEKQVQHETDKNLKKVESQNQQLKRILKDYRKPNKFCMDMVLICMFLGIVAVIYNMIK